MHAASHVWRVRPVCRCTAGYTTCMPVNSRKLSKNAWQTKKRLRRRHPIGLSQFCLRWPSGTGDGSRVRDRWMEDGGLNRAGIAKRRFDLLIYQQYGCHGKGSTRSHQFCSMLKKSSYHDCYYLFNFDLPVSTSPRRCRCWSTALISVIRQRAGLCTVDGPIYSSKSSLNRCDAPLINVGLILVIQVTKLLVFRSSDTDPILFHVFT